MCVYPHDKTKTAETKIAKLAHHFAHHHTSPVSEKNCQKVKGQGHRVIKCKKAIEWPARIMLSIPSALPLVVLLQQWRNRPITDTISSGHVWLCSELTAIDGWSKYCKWKLIKYSPPGDYMRCNQQVCVVRRLYGCSALHPPSWFIAETFCQHATRQWKILFCWNSRLYTCSVFYVCCFMF